MARRWIAPAGETRRSSASRSRRPVAGVAGAVGRRPPPRRPRVHRVSSPNGRIAVAVRATPDLTYDVSFDGKPLLAGATLALDVDHVRLGAAARITGGRRQSVDRKLAPPVRLKSESLVEKYNELRLDCAGGYAVVFRAYDQGMAYRFETALPAAQVKVYGEDAVFRLRPTPRRSSPTKARRSSRTTNRATVACGSPTSPPATSRRCPWSSRAPPAQARDRRGRRRELPRAVAAGHGQRGDRRGVRALPARGEGGQGPRRQGCPRRRLHRRHDRHARLSLAHARGRRHRRRAGHQPAGLPAAAPSRAHDTSWIKPGKVAGTGSTTSTSPA